MKKIVKFIAPNGEYVKWGEFDREKHPLTFEVECYCDNGILLEKKAFDFIIPNHLDLNSELKILSLYRQNGFLKNNEPPEQNDDETSADNRELLVD